MSNLNYGPCNQTSLYKYQSKFELIKNKITKIRMILIYSQPERDKDTIVFY